MNLEQLLQKYGLERYTKVLHENRVDLDILGSISSEELREMGVPLGDRKRFQKLTKELPLVSNGHTLMLFDVERSKPIEMPTELRQITVLFADLSGSTGLAELLDVEDYHTTLAAFHDCVTRIVRQAGGMPARYIGDAVLACFGYPIASENDTRNAALAAMQIIDLLPTIPTSAPNSLQAQIGMATGIAMTGNLLGDGQNSFGPASGTILNLASRLQNLADEATVLVDQKTFLLLRNEFRFADLGEQLLKGFSASRKVWQMLPPDKTDPDRTVAHEKLIPLIGRDEELNRLRYRWEMLQRRGSVVLVAGEAGIGKSKLVAEFERDVGVPDQFVIRMECQANSSLRPLHPIAKAIERLVKDSGHLRVAPWFDRLRAWVDKDLKLSRQTSDILIRLIEPERNKPDAEKTNPFEHKALVFETLVQLIERLRLKAPHLLIIEDIHWIDPTTEEFLEYLVEHVNPLKVLVICTYRPDYRPKFVGGANVSLISLSRLDAHNSTKVMRGVLGANRLPPEMASEIVMRADGVPFFVEELTKAAFEAHCEDDIRVDQQRLPTTLHGSLLARLDRVPNANMIAPVGAAIGRTFPHDLLLAVSDLAEKQAQPILDGLISSGLLIKEGVAPETEYTFKHALVCDTAYEMLPKSRRISVHQRIARVLESNDTKHSAGPHVLATHFSAAREHRKASDYWHDAAIAAQNSLANQEAVSYVEHALAENELIEPETERIDKEIELRELLRNPFARVKLGSPLTLNNLERLRELRELKGDTEQLVSVLHGLAGYYTIIGEIKFATKVAGELLDRFGNDNLIARTLGLRVRAFCNFLSGDFGMAIDDFSLTIELCRDVDLEELGKFYHADTVLVARCMISWARALGNQRNGLADELLAAKEAADQSDVWSRIYAYSLVSAAHQVIGDVEICRDLSQVARDLSIEHGYEYWVAWCSVLHGWAIARQGRASEGIQEIEEGLRRYLETGSRQFLPYGQLLLADTYQKSKMLAEADELFKLLEMERTPADIRYIDGLLACKNVDLI